FQIAKSVNGNQSFQKPIGFQDILVIQTDLCEQFTFIIAVATGQKTNLLKKRFIKTDHLFGIKKNKPVVIIIEHGVLERLCKFDHRLLQYFINIEYQIKIH